MSGDITKQYVSNNIDSEVELFTGAPIRGHHPVIHYFTDKFISTKYDYGKRVYFDLENTIWVDWQKELEHNLNHIAHTLEEWTDAKDLWHKFYEILTETNNKMIPTKTITQHSKPYWSDRLTELSKNVQTARKATQSRYTPVNIEKLSKAKTEFQETLIKEKNEWVRRKVEGLNVSDTNTFWKKYKRVFCPSEDHFMGNLESKGLLLTKSEEKEELLYNTFFAGAHLEGEAFDQDHANVITKEHTDIKLSNWHIHHSNNQMLNREINSEDVSVAIKSQKSTGKSNDGNAIHPIMLKNFGDKAVSVITKLFNLVLDSGDWIWDKAEVCFIKKADKPSYMNPGAYRPLTIAPYIGKLLERILEARLRSYCSENNILDDAQEGFREKRSTNRYLYKLLLSLHDAKRKKLNSIILFLDFEKAFDSVWLPALIVKLHRLGINGRILKLINNFLFERKVQLRINKELGLLRKCKDIGLPQGSVLSPLLFIIFIADMLHNQTLPSTVLEAVNTYKFADDGTVSVICPTLQECHQGMQKSVKA